jgi:hypothetical protein
MSRTVKVKKIVPFLALFIAFSLLSVPTFALEEPFKISETTIFDISSNEIDITLSDSISKEQTVRNISFVFKSTGRTQLIDLSSVTTNQEYDKDVFENVDSVIAEIAQTSNISSDDYEKVKKGEKIWDEVEKDKKKEGNFTNSTVIEVSVDSDGKILECSKKNGSDCIKTEYKKTGTEKATGYLPIEMTKSKTAKVADKVKIDVSTNLVIPRDGSLTIKVYMVHPIVFNEILPADENKYDIVVCTDEGCVVLDPTWWNTTWNYCRNITVTNGKAGYPSLINITNSTHWESGWSSGRFVNSTCGNGGSILNASLRYDGTTYSEWDVKLDGTQNISVYYNNSAAAYYGSVSSVYGSGVIMFHTLDEGSGTVIGDYSGNNHNSTFSGGATNPSWIQMFRKTGLSFDGGDRYNVSDDAMLRNTPSISVFLYFKTTSITSRQFIISKWDYPTPNGDLQWLFKLNDQGKLGVETSGDGGLGGLTSCYSTNAVTQNALYFAGFTYDASTGNVSIWRNGTIDASCNIGANKIVATGTDHVDVGGNNQGGSWSELFSGSLDEIIIWNRKLSVSEIQGMYSSSEPSFVLGLEQSNEPPDNETNETLPNATIGDFTIVFDIANLEPTSTSCFNESMKAVYYAEPNITRYITCAFGCQMSMNDCAPNPL